MKRTVLKLMAASGAFAPVRWMNRGKSLILMYHRFGERDDTVAVRASEFEAHLRYLTSHYSIVPFSAVAESVARGSGVPPGTAAITVDDGYADFFDVAFPIVRRYRVPATVFVVTGFVDGTAWIWTDKLRFVTARARVAEREVRVGDRTIRLRLDGAASRTRAAERVNAVLKTMPDDEKEEALLRIASELEVPIPPRPTDEFRPLDWDQVREMAASGVEIGSHTVTHPMLTKVSPDRLRDEVRRSRRRLEAELGRRVDLFCYPNGDYDAGVKREVGSAGYASAASTDVGLVDGTNTDPLALRRIAAPPDLPHFVQSTSGFEQVKGRVRAAGAAGAV
jgi:peptidoglycan/xylan/chitin deacetylase (PgdA/CDA1 family)